MKQWLIFTALVLGIGLYVVPSNGQVRKNGGQSIDLGTGTMAASCFNSGADGCVEVWATDQRTGTTNSPRHTALSLGTSGTGNVMTAGNGSWTLTGDGDGTDESITFGLNSSNLWSLSSGSGVTAAFFSGLLVSAPGFIRQDGGTTTVDGATTFAVPGDYFTLACTGAETINTITGGSVGRILYIMHTDTECTIADDDAATAANAIDLTGTGTNDVGAVNKVLVLIYNGSYWLEVGESDN